MTPRRRRHLDRTIERELMAELSPRQQGRLHAQLRADPLARAAYDRTVAALRVLEDRDIAATELDVVARRLFAGRAWQGAEEPAQARPRAWWAAVAGVLAVAAVVALVVARPGQDRPSPAEYIAARSGTAPSSGLAIDALCGPADADSVLHPAGSAGCPASGRLSFAYAISGAVPTGSLLTLFAVDDHGQVNFYAPTPDGITSVVTVAGRWQALPLSIALPINHGPGRWRIYAVTTPVPVTPAAVTEAAAALTANREAPPTTPWTERLTGQCPISRLCATADTCHTAEIELWIEEETP